MKRTCQRPLVLGTHPNWALFNGIGLGTAGLFGLYQYNPMTAALGAVIWAGYLFSYTPMKRQS